MNSNSILNKIGAKFEILDEETVIKKTVDDLKNGKAIGYVTSGGFAHFTNKSVAFSYLDSREINSEKGIQVEINGDLFNSSVIKSPLYDPTGQKMRS